MGFLKIVLQIKHSVLETKLPMKGDDRLSITYLISITLEVI